jgi:hypothetical protein
MRILVDDNIPRMTVNRLRELGHDVKDIRRTGDKGLTDAELWDVALRERRLPGQQPTRGSTEYRAAFHHASSLFGCASRTVAKIHQCGDAWHRAVQRGRLAGTARVVIRDTTHEHGRAPEARSSR